jgi:hypothetical protein
MGKKITVTREQLVDFVLDTIEQINQQNDDHRFISDAFKQCGLNPWSRNKSLEAFKQHLDKLETNEVLRAMLVNQKAIDLLH